MVFEVLEKLMGILFVEKFFIYIIVVLFYKLEYVKRYVKRYGRYGLR